MNPRIISYRDRLDNLYRKTSTISDQNDRKEWSKYLCVLTSGWIEESLRTLLNDYARFNASPKIQHYVSKEIDNITNCKTDKIIQILSKFDAEWGKQFEEKIDNRSPIHREIKDSIDTVVANRHRIAHGRSVGMTYTRISGFYNYCKTAIEVLDEIIA